MIEQLNLFNKENQNNKLALKIVRIDDNHAKKGTDHLNCFSRMILSNAEMYPGINKWLKQKVIPGLKNTERVAYIAYDNDRPIISAVVKRGDESKFCHLKIDDKYQDNNYGEMFFVLMSLDIRKYAKTVFFTLPEKLWEDEKNFFKSFGFNKANKNDIQYRMGHDELVCRNTFADLWCHIPDRIAKLKLIFNAGNYSLDNGIVLSIQPKYADAILTGRKKVEIRAKFDERFIGSNMAIYSTAPQKAIVGQAKIVFVLKNPPEIIWEKYSSQIGCSEKEYKEYTSSHKEVYAIILDEIKPYSDKIFLTQLSHLTKNDLRPPQSYYKLNMNNTWNEAITIANLLQNNIKTETIFI